MKALTYRTAHTLDEFNLTLEEVPTPILKEYDLLVEVKAFSINPVDYKVRSSRTSEQGSPVILGWDAAGTVKAIGSKVQNFKLGDKVYYSGELTRDGSYAEMQAIDSRLVGHMPNSLSFTDAAALPLTTITAYEALFEKNLSLGGDSNVLIIGGAGGVGSIAIQLLKAKTQARVIATAGREETKAWVTKMGADITVDHSKNLSEELKQKGIETVDVVFGTTHSDKYLGIIPSLLRSFGHFILIDDPKTLDIVPFKRKALSVHWEFMFSKSLHGYKMESQGNILSEVARLVDEGKIKSTVTKVLKGLTPQNLKEAHSIVERGSSIGKIVVEL